MDFKRFWKESWTALVIRNVLLALLAVFIISYITLSFIDKYTRHGEAEVVPDLKGRYTEEADILLAAQGLRYEVIDSTYDRTQPFGVIVEQTPPELAGDIVEKGIVLTGGGAMLKGLPELLEKELKVPILIAESPLTCVAEGTGTLLDNISLLEEDQ